MRDRPRGGESTPLGAALYACKPLGSDLGHASGDRVSAAGQWLGAFIASKNVAGYRGRVEDSWQLKEGRRSRLLNIA